MAEPILAATGAFGAEGGCAGKGDFSEYATPQEQKDMALVNQPAIK